MDSKITRIDLGDWVKSGEGAIGASYNHKEDPTLMLKMNLTDAPLDTWEREIRCAESVYRLGIPTPKPGTIVTDGEHYGLMFQRIPNKISYARAAGEHPENIDKLAKDFAAVVKRLHGTVAKTEGVTSLKDYLRENIARNPFHDETYKAKMYKLVDTIPDGDKALHGDLHFGNVIMADGKDYLIDLGNFCYGHPMYDLAMSMIVNDMADFMTAMFENNYHCTKEQGHRFFQCFFNEYFGKEVDMDQLRTELLPYIALRNVTAENEMGAPLPAEAEAVTRQFIENL